MSSITTDLAEVLAGIERPGDFCTTGVSQVFTPGLEVEGVGPIALPFLSLQLAPLIAAAERAPFGRGDQTLVDTDVRRTWQVDARKVSLRGQGWAKSLTGIVDRVAGGLGVAEPIKAELYKLLVYEEGGFFVSHRDTEKAPGMFATLIVVLPSIYTGGELMVRHKDREVRFSPRGEDPSEVAFAAFYADCLHELLPVTSGCRLALVYNLLRGAGGDAPKPPNHDAEQGRLAALLRHWSEEETPRGSRDEDDGGDGEEEPEDDGETDEDADLYDDDDENDDGPPVKLIYPLEHVYTPASLSFDALKGADAARAASLLAATRAADCDLHLALLSIEESGSAVYTGYGYRRGRRYEEEEDEDDYDVIEVSDCEETLSEWRRPDGRAAGLGVLPALSKEMSPPDALKDMLPDKQSFFEATGNEGASFERSYRKAALVVWPRHRRLAVVNQGGLAATLPYLARLVEQWTGAGQDDRSSVWAVAHELSGHMAAAWPIRSWRQAANPGDVTTMLTLLGRLGDLEHIDRLLDEVCARSLRLQDNEAVLAALQHLPKDRKIDLLTHIVAKAAPSMFDAAADLLARACAAATDGKLDLALTHLMPAAAALLDALPGDPARTPAVPSWQRDAPPDPHTLVNALAALDRIDSKLAGAAVDNILAWPNVYDLDKVIIPTMLAFDASAESAAVTRLRTACAVHLRSRIAEALAPPGDWKRVSTVDCRCERCRQLSRFLADPTLQKWSYRAVQADRSHVEDTVKRSECDADITTLRQGSPHTLICTKNQASYERRARQRAHDLENLARIESRYPA